MGIDTAKGFRLPDFETFWYFLDPSIRQNFSEDQNIPEAIAEEFTVRVAQLVSEGRGGEPIATMRIAIMDAPQLTLAGRPAGLGSSDILVRLELSSSVNKRLTGKSGGSFKD